jgi:hypothetical protein
VLFDKIAVGLLVLSFAALVTTHVALTIGLARRPRRWRAWVAFFAFPLAPWWGWKANMRVRGGLWLAAASCYGLSLLFASAV